MKSNQGWSSLAKGNRASIAESSEEGKSMAIDHAVTQKFRYNIVDEVFELVEASNEDNEEDDDGNYDTIGSRFPVFHTPSSNENVRLKSSYGSKQSSSEKKKKRRVKLIDMK